MIQELVEAWDKNKTKLEEWLKANHPESYKQLFKKVIELVINSDDDKYDIEKMTVIDNGDYQGTQLFIIPEETYQPSADQYLFTHNYYGSCSGCDSLQAIREYDDNPPTEAQIKDYMGLALNLIQRTKKWGNLGDE